MKETKTPTKHLYLNLVVVCGFFVVVVGFGVV